MTPKEYWIVARNTVRVLQDSNRLAEIMEVGDITCRSRIQQEIALLEQSDAGRALLADRPEINTREVDFDALRALPADRFGRVYIDHMDRHGLSADAINQPQPHDDDPVEVYLMRRYRGNHDVWHALLGLGTEGHEEVLVHAFTYGQLRLPLSVLVVFFGTLKHIILERRWSVLFRSLVAYYRRGRAAAPLLGVRWEALWTTPLGDVRQRFRLT